MAVGSGVGVGLGVGGTTVSVGDEVETGVETSNRWEQDENTNNTSKIDKWTRFIVHEFTAKPTRSCLLNDKTGVPVLSWSMS